MTYTYPIPYTPASTRILDVQTHQEAAGSRDADFVTMTYVRNGVTTNYSMDADDWDTMIQDQWRCLAFCNNLFNNWIGYVNTVHLTPAGPARAAGSAVVTKNGV